MTTVSTFGSVTLTKPRVMSVKVVSPSSVDTTTAARTTIQGTTEYSYEVRVRCHTSTFGDITGLYAKLGSKDTLKIHCDAETTPPNYYKNMKLIGGITITPDELGTQWFYEATFRQETV